MIRRGFDQASVTAAAHYAAAAAVAAATSGGTVGDASGGSVAFHPPTRLVPAGVAGAGVTASTVSPASVPAGVGGSVKGRGGAGGIAGMSAGPVKHMPSTGGLSSATAKVRGLPYRSTPVEILSFFQVS